MVLLSFGVVTDSTGIMRHILQPVWRRKRSVKYNCKK